VTVDFSSEAYQTMEEISKELGTTKVEVLRKALGLLHFVLEERRSGGKLIIENPKENLKKEIVSL
jgi:hypothetical protein